MGHSESAPATHDREPSMLHITTTVSAIPTTSALPLT